MFSGKEAASYPTQWALNPTAYQNIDSSQVDWAALAQQWIAMKDAAVALAAPPPAPKPEVEEGEAPMEVENAESSMDSNSVTSTGSGSHWNSAPSSWSNNWNQWGAGWDWPGPNVEPKNVDSPNVPPMIDNFPPSDGPSQIPGYSTRNASTFQHGYWTSPQIEETAGSSGKPTKPKTREIKQSSKPRRIREKHQPLAIDPIVVPPVMPPSTLDAAKRRQLPAWIREGLEKMEREKQRAIEREEELKARIEMDKERERFEKEELARLEAEAQASGPVMPAKSKFETDSEEETDKEVTEPDSAQKPEVEVKRENKDLEQPLLAAKSKEDIMQEVMLTVRRSLTEILLEVTDYEILTVSQEELARFTTTQASRLNAKASKSKALAAISSNLGLGAYESSSDESGDEQDDITDQELQDVIKRKRAEFEQTSREIEAEVRRAEQRDNVEEGVEATPPHVEHDKSNTPPPTEQVSDKNEDRGLTRNKKINHKIDHKKPEINDDHKTNDRSSKPHKHAASENASSDSSSSSSSSSESESDTSHSKRSKKSRRYSESEKRTKHKKSKRAKETKEYERERREESRRKEKQEYKSRRDYDKYKDRYKERARRDSRKSRDSKRDRSHDRRYDKYERSRDHREYKRSRSRSHRR